MYADPMLAPRARGTCIGQRGEHVVQRLLHIIDAHTAVHILYTISWDVAGHLLALPRKKLEVRKQQQRRGREGFRGEELPAYDPRLPLTHTE